MNTEEKDVINERPAEEFTSGEKTHIPESGTGGDKPPKKAESSTKKAVKISVFAAIIASLLLAVLVSQITFLAVSHKYEKLLASMQGGQAENGLDLPLLKELDELYRQYYVGEITEEQLEYMIMQGYVAGTGDVYGNYMSKDEYKEYYSSLNSSLVGIGVNVLWSEKDMSIEILRVFPDSPAEKGGLQHGDMIIAVDGVSVKELGYDAAVDAIKGEIGTKVNITVTRNGEEMTFTCTRDTVNVLTVNTKVIDGNIGYISISNFYAETPNEVKAAVEAHIAAGCDRLIFDMRNNTGGLLNSVEATLDYLLPEGVIVRFMNDRNETVSDPYISDKSSVDLPMTIIVNEYSASAAELFTSTIMDFADMGKADATVIGTQTYGKGTVTRGYPLSDGSVIWISVERYCPPVSDNFEGVGITPDIVLELSDEAKKISLYKLTYEQDTQLQKAVEEVKKK